MSTYWPDFAYGLYERACMELDYPHIPFGPFINKLISRDDVVADIGCGIGMPAFYLAQRCKNVIAIDENKDALDYLEKRKEKEGVYNITTICGKWPDVPMEPCDALISFYASGVTRDKYRIEMLLKTARRGILTGPGPNPDGGFFMDIAKALGVPGREQKCDNGCLVRGKLEMMGCKVSCETIVHDFGQPLNDIEEATKFLSWQLRLDESYFIRIKDVAEKFLTTQNGKLYLPNPRSICILTYSI